MTRQPASRLRSAVPVDGPVEGWVDDGRIDDGRVDDGRVDDGRVDEPEPTADRFEETAAPAPDLEKPDVAPAPAPEPARRRIDPRRLPRALWRGTVAAGRGTVAAGRAVAGWPRRPSGRLVLPGLLILALIGLFVFVGSYVVPGLPTPTHRAFAFLEGPPGGVPAEPGGDLPDQTGPDQGGTGQGGTGQQPTRPSDLRAWATPVSTKLDIPLPAMQAYGYAELATAATQPGCQLRWTTLAGIGKVESNHGRHNASLAPDGKALPPIYGEPLNGQGVAAIKDTDQGRIDGDKTWDRAVGPMQFIPSTWEKYASDADGDGVADINDIDDAALAAARYLCAGNRNMGTVGDWWAAILSYNALQQYAHDVFTAANDYGVRSR